MLIVAAVALASATLHGGQAQKQQRPTARTPRPAAAPAPARIQSPAPVRPALVASSKRQAPPLSVAMQRQVMDQYFVTCHNSRAKTAGLAFDAVDLANV